MGLLRKSKPQSIKSLWATLALGALVLAGTAGAARPVPLHLVRIAVDTTADTGAQHATIVEPDAAAVGTRIVSAFQVGRIFGGSAGTIGFATSLDAGRTWRNGLVPGAPAELGRVKSDPVVAYDALHGRWLIASLVNDPIASSIAVNGSGDGLTWDPPFTAVSYARDPATGTVLDKEWLTCDNGTASRFLGRCYLAYTDLAHDLDPRRRGSNIGVQMSTDGGVSWSAPVLLGVDADQVSPAVQPVVRPNGELVIVLFEDGVVEAIRSDDGAATFAPRERVSGLNFRGGFSDLQRMRAFSLPTATADRAGNVYVAWPDCRFRPRCSADDIVWSRSSAPGAWTPVRRLPVVSRGGETKLVLPDIATDPAAPNRLALSYYALTPAGLDVFLVTSKTAGRTWSKPRRLNPQRMRLTWLAETASGRMVGDYMGTVFSGARVVAVHVQARAPRAGQFNEALYAASIPRP